MRLTRGWRTTSVSVKVMKATPSRPVNVSMASRSPDRTPLGRSTWLKSPVMTMEEFSPSRVRNIFICTAVVFWASSRITKALDRVRPRMKARGATSISPFSRRLTTWDSGSMSNSAS